MKQSQKLLIAIGLGVLILMNVFVLGWVLADVFSGSNGPEETGATTDNWENTIGAEPTEEEPTEEPSPEPTREVPLTEESTTEAPEIPLIEIEQPLDEVKSVIHTFSWGSGIGEVGYHEAKDAADSDMGPIEFFVENDAIYVLDYVNKRLLICKNDECVAVDMTPIGGSPTDMIYGNQRIAVMDSNLGKTGVYDEDGTLIKLIEHSEVLPSGSWIASFVAMGKTSVIWVGTNNYYLCDWEKGSLEELREYRGEDWAEIKTEGLHSIVRLGIDGTALYYQNWEPDSKSYVLNKEAEGYRWFVKINYDEWKSLNSRYGYFSSDGRLYLMECLKENVVISEISLGAKK